MGQGYSFESNESQTERARRLDELGGWRRPPVKRGDSLSASSEWLQTQINSRSLDFGDLLDVSGTKAKVDMARDTLKQLQHKQTELKRTHKGDKSHPQIIEINEKIIHAMQHLRLLQTDLEGEAQQKLDRRTSLPKDNEPTPSMTSASGRGLPAKPKLWVQYSGAPSRVSSRRLSSDAALDSSRPGSVAGLKPTGSMRRYSLIDDTSANGTARQGPQIPGVITQYDPEYYELHTKTPQWRVNIARAKRTFWLAWIGSRGFEYRLVLKNRPRAKLHRVPSFGVYVPKLLNQEVKKFQREQMSLMVKHDRASGGNGTRFGGSQAKLDRSTTRHVSSKRLASLPSSAGTSNGTSSLFGDTAELAELAPVSDLINVASFEVPKNAVKNLQLMRLLVNRANTAWTEERAWLWGKAFDIGNFKKMGQVDKSHYTLSAVELLKGGKVAYQIHDSDVIMALRDGEQLPMWLQDPWDTVMGSLNGARVPVGDRFKGLSYACRLMLSLHLAVEKAAGAAAVEDTIIILHIPAAYTDEIVERFVRNRFYGFKAENVVFCPTTSFAGYCFHADNDNFEQAEDALLDSPGSGESMRQLLYLKEGFTAPKGERVIMPGSIMDHLKYHDVEWLRSMFIDDVIGSSTENIIDVTTMAMMLHSHKTYGTQMMVQVCSTTDIDSARANGNIILSACDPALGKLSRTASMESPSSKTLVTETVTGDAHYTVQQVMFDDLQSQKWHQRLQQLRLEASKDGRESPVLTSTRRFFSSIPALSRILKEKSLFHVSLTLQGPFVYPKLDMSDITTHPQSKCVAFTTTIPKSTGLRQTTAFAEELIPCLTSQDQSPVFRTSVGKWAPTGVEVITKHSVTSTAKPRNFVLVVLTEQGARQRERDGEASREAYDYFRSVIGPVMTSDDKLHIITTSRSGGVEAATRLLNDFTDDLLDLHKPTRTVVERGSEPLVATLEQHIEMKKADLVVIGTNEFDQQSAAGAIHLGSITHALIRQLLCPVLVVKPCRALQDVRKCIPFVNPLHVVFQVATVDQTSQHTFDFLASLMNKSREDALFLTHSNGQDAEGAETQSCRATLGSFQRLAVDAGLNAFRRPLEGMAKAHLPKVVETEKAHMLALHTGKIRNLSDEIKELLAVCRCPVLVYK